MDDDLNIFLSALESQIANSSLSQKIKSTSKDSLEYLIPIFRSEYMHLLDQQDWENPIDQSYYRSDTLLRDEILLWSFRKHLNRESVDKKEVLNEVIVNRQMQEKEIRQKEQIEKNELIQLISENDQNFQVGDTLDVTMQIDVQNNFRHIYYTKYPKSLDYSSADDSLLIRGVLVRKTYGKDTDNVRNAKGVNPLDLIFVIKITELSQSNVYNVNKALRIGDEFHLHLEAYARAIN